MCLLFKRAHSTTGTKMYFCSIVQSSSEFRQGLNAAQRYINYLGTNFPVVMMEQFNERDSKSYPFGSYIPLN